MNNSKSVRFWDRIGIGLSAVCAIHCLFFPIAVAILPMWPAAYSIHNWTHPVFFFLIVPTVLFALKNHDRSLRIPLLLYGGLAGIGLAWILHDWVGPTGEASITIVGSLFLIAGHWFNYREHISVKKKMGVSDDEKIEFHTR